MKNLLIVIAFTLLVCYQPSYAQCTNPFFEYKKGTKIGMTNYNSKDKVESTVLMTVKEINATSGGFETVMHARHFDKKDKEVYEGDFALICENDNIYIDMKRFITPEMTQSMGDFQMEMKSKNLEIPANLTSGQQLPDAYIEVKTVNSPISLTFTTDFKDRKVDGKTTIETSAGKFDCYKISYVMQSKAMMMNMQFEVIDYIAEKVGTVRTESYRKGKLQSYTELTSYEP
ncbi:MAG: hypothetical protein ACFCUU_19525 [Cyclobacteriaceae bacterium]